MIKLVGTLGDADADSRLFFLYTGGTIGMTYGQDGSLVPLSLEALAPYFPDPRTSGTFVTVATLDPPIDSAEISSAHWIDIADALVEFAPGHHGALVLHGTDTMAYTASALSFLLDDISIPIVLTGAQRPLTEARSDSRENLTIGAAVALARASDGTAAVPEVVIAFDDVVLRGNRSSKVDASAYRAFASPNAAPLARIGVTIDYDHGRIRHASKAVMRRGSGLCAGVTGIRLHPGINEAMWVSAFATPGLRGLVIEAYGSGNGPSSPWFIDAVRQAVEAGIVVVVVTQCRSGAVHQGTYATGSALQSAGAISGADMTFEAALTKLMVTLDRYPLSEVAGQMTSNSAGELTTGD